MAAWNCDTTLLTQWRVGQEKPHPSGAKVVAKRSAINLQETKCARVSYTLGPAKTSILGLSLNSAQAPTIKTVPSDTRLLL